MLEFLGGLALELGDGVWSVVSGVIGWVFGALASIIIALSAALPDDPIRMPEVVQDWELGLSWLNWFVPVGQIAVLMAAWVAATISYFFFQFILKQIANSKL